MKPKAVDQKDRFFDEQTDILLEETVYDEVENYYDDAMTGRHPGGNEDF